MARPPVSLASLAILAAITVGLVIATQGGRGVQWRTLEPGLEFAEVRGEPYCRQGSATIGVLRIDPERQRIRVHHYGDLPESQPASILQWLGHTNATAVFNAGQYYPDLAYMGLLVSDGRIISDRRHPEFQAALVSGARSGRAQAHVLDLSSENLGNTAKNWKNVAQSFMLFDRTGGMRVRKSDRVAHRTVVGEDAQGQIIVLTTEGGYTLWELAQLLRDGPLQLTHAMSMDGGAEAKMCVKKAAFAWASFGPWNGDAGIDVPGAAVPLPAVISVSPR